MSRVEAVRAVLLRQRPKSFVFAPNCWQWFQHQKNRSLPAGLANCDTQFDMLRRLDADIFSRSLATDQHREWFGGLCDIRFDGRVRCSVDEYADHQDRVILHTFTTPKGTLTERRRYVWEQSTLVQEKFLVEDLDRDLDALEEIVAARRWTFDTRRYRALERQVGDAGLAIAGELYSPLKLLHWSMGPVLTSYFIADAPERAAAIMAAHEAAMLELTRDIVAARVPVVMSMDNLDVLFHPPRQVERYSASFYERASRICHDAGSCFFIHACGKQRANLRLISSLGVDGLEGVAFPTLGDTELDHAMELSGDRFLITGGISALEFERLSTRDDVFRYVEELFARMRPYAHRFVFSSSCNTPYNASWQAIEHFRDAWRAFGGL
jgi:hypothetical protein